MGNWFETAPPEHGLGQTELPEAFQPQPVCEFERFLNRMVQLGEKLVPALSLLLILALSHVPPRGDFQTLSAAFLWQC